MATRDPLVIMHACADEVPGTLGEALMRELADRFATCSNGGDMIGHVRARLRLAAELHTMYGDDERAAFALAAAELVR